jgi:hypothetical protein
MNRAWFTGSRSNPFLRYRRGWSSLKHDAIARRGVTALQSLRPFGCRDFHSLDHGGGGAEHARSFVAVRKELTMHEVHGQNKKTLKYEMIASEISKQELDMLLKQERDNYVYMTVSRLRYR